MDVLFRGRSVRSAYRTVLVLVLVVFLPWTGVGCSRNSAKYAELLPRDGVVSVDLSDIGAERGHFHTYRSRSGKKVDFFVYRDRAGAPHAVLDACRTCYRWRKGYVLSGKEVVCLKCDMRFTLDNLAGGSGSCVPIALKGEEQGQSFRIPVDQLEAGASFF